MEPELMKTLQALHALVEQARGDEEVLDGNLAAFLGSEVVLELPDDMPIGDAWTLGTLAELLELAEGATK